MTKSSKPHPRLSDAATDQDNDDDVGYGRPPKSGQFKPGQSGNSKGRPKGAVDASYEQMIVEELSRKVTILEGGKPVQITIYGACLWQLQSLAARGNMKAHKRLMKHQKVVDSINARRPVSQQLVTRVVDDKCKKISDVSS